jgi:valyl-tRNA synthetase
MKEIPKLYNPKEVETKIYKFWEKTGFFNPDKLPKTYTLNAKPYSIVIPPPNITGSLHMGHALNCVIQDILIRKKRMEGFRTLWLPGTDHAGIATQYVVEKELKKEGKTRFDLGREKFIERVWQWVEKYGGIILEQFKRLGCSLDWSRKRFTLDKEYVKAVETAFWHYYKKGLIYQGERVVNWCPRCKTSLSDLEIEYEGEKGNLWYIKYPVKSQKSKVKSQNFIVVATTRPETMLGDSAVAVNPKDERYKDFVGKKAILPLVGREIPIVADNLVDKNFGTGAVKITPAHDLKDYEISKRHNLKIYKVIDEEERITNLAPEKYRGLSIFEAREKIVEDLKEKGLLEKIEDFWHSVPKCYRCKTKIEFLPMKQWFLKMGNLAKTAIDVVKSQKVKFFPKRFEKIYFDWLKNTKDWCISRQIWWGHKIPAWQCQIKTPPTKKMGFDESRVWQVFKGKTCTWRLRDHNFKPGDVVAFEVSQTGEIFGYGEITKVEKTKVGKLNLKDKSHYQTYKNREELIKAFKRFNPQIDVNEETPVFVYYYKFRKITSNDGGCGKIIVSDKKLRKCPNCGSINLVPVTDVLDTWFSSALWPFATLGWPEKKVKSQKSKVKSDLDRFYPTNVLSTGRDIINLWVARMIFSGMEFMKKPPFKIVLIHPTVLTKEGKRMSKSLGTGADPMEFIEKYGADATRFGIIWQVMGNQDLRFTEDHIKMGQKFCNKVWNASRFVLLQIQNSKIKIQNENLKLKKKKLGKDDKKILKALNKTIKSVNKSLENFQFGRAAHSIYNFFWHDFCDKYLENIKSQISNVKSKKEKENKIKILLYILLNSLILLHPFIPFITEEIYQILPIKNRKKSLMIEKWPKQI